MMFYLKFQDIAHHALYLLYARVAKLNYLAAVDANDMVVLFVAI